VGIFKVAICDLKARGASEIFALRLHRARRIDAGKRPEQRTGGPDQCAGEVVRAFVRLRQMLASNAELARKLAALENKYDAQFKVVFDAIRQLMSPPAKPKREIGFHVKYDDDKPKSKR
jgi:hypothetical protein